VTVVVFFSGNAAFNFLLAFFLQTGLGYAAFDSGMTFSPLGVGFLTASLFGRKLTPYLGRKVLALGAVLMALGYSGVIITISSNAHSLLSLKGYSLLPALFLEGLGQGMVAVPLIGIILAGVAPEAVGSASGMLSTANQIAQAMGVALIGIIFFGLLPPRQLTQSGTTTAKEMVAQDYANAFSASLIFLISLALATLLLVIFLAAKNRPKLMNDQSLPEQKE
jgi:MFS family permease